MILKCFVIFVAGMKPNKPQNVIKVSFPGYETETHYKHKLRSNVNPTFTRIKRLAVF